jgi:hypothetical protein
MSTKPLGTLLYVRRVVADFTSAFALYRRFMAPRCHADERLATVPQ